MTDTATASLTPEVMEAVSAYAHAAEDERAAVELHNLAARAAGAYKRDHYDAIEDDDPDAVDAYARAVRAAELAAAVRAAKTAEEWRARVRLSELAGTGHVTEDAIRARCNLELYGNQAAARVVLAALADA